VTKKLKKYGIIYIPRNFQQKFKKQQKGNCYKIHTATNLNDLKIPPGNKRTVEY
jgi:hypothetical protein